MTDTKLQPGPEAEFRRIRNRVQDGKRLSASDGKALWDTCILLSRMAAKTPQFSNPLVVFDAQRIRDRFLEVLRA